MKGDLNFFIRRGRYTRGELAAERCIRGENGHSGEEAKKGGSWNPGWNLGLFYWRQALVQHVNEFGSHTEIHLISDRLNALTGLCIEIALLICFTQP